jgi:hypothetical protein
MSGEDAHRPCLENLIVPEIKTNKQISNLVHNQVVYRHALLARSERNNLYSKHKLSLAGQVVSSVIATDKAQHLGDKLCRPFGMDQMTRVETADFPPWEQPLDNRTVSLLAHVR